MSRKSREVFDVFKELSTEDQISFRRLLEIDAKEMRIEIMAKRREFVKQMESITNEKGEQYFSTEWLEQNILNPII